jgi:hypothetical protein
MDLLLALLHASAYVSLGLAVPLPKLRRVAIAALAAAAAASLLHGVFGPAERELTTTHTYPGFDGSAIEVSAVAFPTGTVRAAGWQWPLPFAAFAAAWIAVLWRLRAAAPGNGYMLPMLFAWSGLAAWLGMQALAAPAAVVQPFGIDRFLYPAGLALALLLARSAGGIRHLVAGISIGTVAARLPAALFSKVASDRELGTGLDVSRVIDIVNPLNHMQFEPRLEPGSPAQQFWLIWAEHVFAYPAFYMLSLVGIGFCAHMFHRHGNAPE